MPARDADHDVVKRVLIADGWTITHDPLFLRLGKRDLFVDLGAQRLIAATKAERKIAIEIKGFSGASEIRDLEGALGQFTLYEEVLRASEPDRCLYLAIEKDVQETLFDEPIGRLLIERGRIRLLVFDRTEGSIVRWIP